MKTGEDLILEVYEHPWEDTARIVYGDWLLERGDPRGEFIALQFKDKKKGLSISERVRMDDLIRENHAKWLGDLSKVVRIGEGSKTRFERGFVSSVELMAGAKKKLAKKIYQALEWRTVEQVIPYPFDHDDDAVVSVWKNANLRNVTQFGTLLDDDDLKVIGAQANKFSMVREIEIACHMASCGWMRRTIKALKGVRCVKVTISTNDEDVDVDAQLLIVEEFLNAPESISLEQIECVWPIFDSRVPVEVGMRFEKFADSLTGRSTTIPCVLLHPPNNGKRPAIPVRLVMSSSGLRASKR